MRICFVSFSAYGYFNTSMYSQSSGGGAQRQLYLISKELINDVDISFIVGDYGQKSREEYDGITLYKSFSPIGSTLKKPLETLKLYQAMKRADPDVFVSRQNPKTSVVIYSLAKLLRKKFVLNIANDVFVEGFRRVPFPFKRTYVHMLNRSDNIIVQTKYQQQCLSDLFGVDSTVVPNGYDTSDTNRRYKNRNCFLWVGHLDPNQKRPQLFLDIAEQTPSAEFLLIGARGTEEYRENLRQKMTEMDNLDYRFDVAPDEIHQYYQRAIALVSTSAYEGFPNTFLEAWRVGTPVLSLSVDPGRFLEQDETTDFQAGDIETLSELVREFDANEEYWERVSRTVKHRFEKKYSIDEVADRYAEVIENTVR